MENGQSARWDQVVELAKNENIDGLGFSHGSTHRDLKHIQEVYHSADFIHSKDQSIVAILEDDQERVAPNFMIYKLMCPNWIDFDVSSIIHLSK